MTSSFRWTASIEVLEVAEFELVRNPIFANSNSKKQSEKVLQL